MLFFRSEEHLDRWCRTWKLERGATLNLEQGWRLAQAWYGPDRRDPSWRRRNLEETEALFAELGLTSPFWNLQPAKTS
jgi:hypothetical protein